MNNGNDKDFFIATKEKNDFLIYASELYKLSEIDLINLIKICIIEARNKGVGKKILAVYRDSTETRKHITQERLNLIGISETGDTKPTKQRKVNLK